MEENVVLQIQVSFNINSINVYFDLNFRNFEKAKGKLGVHIIDVIIPVSNNSFYIFGNRTIVTSVVSFKLMKPIVLVVSVGIFVDVI